MRERLVNSNQAKDMIPLIGLTLIIGGSALLWLYFKPPVVDPYISDEELASILERLGKQGDIADGS